MSVNACYQHLNESVIRTHVRMGTRRVQFCTNTLGRQRGGAMRNAFSWKIACVAISICAAMTTASRAQVFTNLVAFDGSNGANPDASLIQGTDGYLYGTTSDGGTSTGCTAFIAGCGTVFKVSPGGVLTTIYNFCTQANCADGIGPEAGLTLGTDGNLYGTTDDGGDITCDGPSGCGTVFRLSPQGQLTTLHTFEGYPTDGAHPAAPLALGADGNFYGTTQTGGDSGLSCYPYGCGTVYRISPSGVLTILHSFCPQLNCEDGVQPGAGLVQGSDGIFYGTTLNGGTKGMGTVFKITPRGKESVLYNFCSGANCIDGAYPEGGLVQGTDENFYGTTTAGGPAGYGTVFEITPGGMHTTLHNFDPTDSWPTAE